MSVGQRLCMHKLPIGAEVGPVAEVGDALTALGDEDAPLTLAVLQVGMHATALRPLHETCRRIGFEAALTLARAGAHVIVAARNPERGEHAVQRIKANIKSAHVEYMQVDLSLTTSIVAFAKAFKQRGLPLHVLIQNAGVFLQPASITDDGLEVCQKKGDDARKQVPQVTVATNFIGPHLLLSLLSDTLAASSPSRVVFIASSSEQLGSVAAMEDLTCGRHRSPPLSNTLDRGTHVHEPKLLRYGTTKLWTLMCVPEWQRRLGPRGVEVVACHPGLSKSSLFGKFSPTDAVGRLFAVWEATLAQSQGRGALSMLYCATQPVPGGAYVGPWYAWWCNPGLSLGNTARIKPVHPAAHDRALCARLFAKADALVSQLTARVDVR